MTKSISVNMDKPEDLGFKVGQQAEMITFEEGYRGAWFRCKIKDIDWRKYEVLPEYFDFPDEVIKWTKLYQVQVSPYGWKTKSFKKQLMLRPKYPPMYDKSQIPSIDMISEVSIILERPWKVGDLVDWHEEECYWAGRIVQVLDKDRVKIELPLPPAGEGKSYVALCKDLRPSLDWSPKGGWRLQTLEGRSSCCARLISPEQGVCNQPDINSDRRAVHAAGSVSLDASSSSHISATANFVPADSNAQGSASKQPPPVNLIHSVDLPQSQEVNMGVDVVESVNGKASSLDSIATLEVQETETGKRDCFNATIPLNFMLDDTLEAPILDLEELANKIRWMKGILQSHLSSNGSRSSWKFVEQRR